MHFALLALHMDRPVQHCAELMSISYATWVGLAKRQLRAREIDPDDRVDRARRAFRAAKPVRARVSVDAPSHGYDAVLYVQVDCARLGLSLTHLSREALLLSYCLSVVSAGGTGAAAGIRVARGGESRDATPTTIVRRSAGCRSERDDLLAASVGIAGAKREHYCSTSMAVAHPPFPDSKRHCVFFDVC